MTAAADDPELLWKSAKSFMGWKSQGTPNQLNVGNQLITSAKLIAQAMNEFFISMYVLGKVYFLLDPNM